MNLMKAEHNKISEKIPVIENRLKELESKNSSNEWNVQEVIAEINLQK